MRDGMGSLHKGILWGMIPKDDSSLFPDLLRFLKSEWEFR